MKRKTKKFLIIVLSVMLFGLIFASASIFGKDDWNNLKNKFNDLTQQEEVVSKNLVNNSDFKINTTGITIFNETNCTTETANLIDNWVISPYECIDFTIYQVSDGLMIFNDDADHKLSVRQRFTENNCAEKYVNKDLTFTTSINGVVYSFSMNLEMGKQATLKIPDGSVNIAVSTHPSINQLSVLYEVSASSNVVINWAQLEEGSVFTGYNG